MYSWIAWTAPTTTTVDHGDSGGPVYSGGYAMGSITGWAGLQSMFSDIVQIQDSLGVSFYRVG